MQQWLPVIDQVVVVDSHSDDGTWELLREHLGSHPGVSFHRRPRGLYQAWNYGLSKLETDLAYISTVGDSITKRGLEHLRDVAGRFGADVVISRPHFIEEDGSEWNNTARWPIVEVLETLDISEPSMLDEWLLVLFLVENPADAILGSSASNIYRRETLQRLPFPTEYGTVGDGAWGLANLFGFRLAVTPERFSTFRRHDKSYAMADYEVADLNGRLFGLMSERFASVLRSDPERKKAAERLGYEKLIRMVAERTAWQKKLTKARRTLIPWVCNPWAWHCRSMRNQLRTSVKSEKQKALKQLCRAQSSLG